ncbi:YbaB/EbfC family nucleoid-associated protein [Mycoplasma struthionis]|uniref:Nucleoid-associated protein EGN60_03165 n=1 Tax=Mycoplasma struthionis TaxID=538220 RepID=A0A3G8LGV1_9MOLU|nr:YbaB/EbfC family nucleoid-associated protein [Mycoplasma struthionis]AZG68923.1 YbaB/EbfC family nucleoid-associated protein [Mycoplasma struthionis]TPI01164.1 YbaB/EbfC family nucleoid-associated protein [Mycoplasma struthionis]
MNMNEMLKKAKRMQAEMEKEEKLIEGQEFTVEKQGIVVVMDGHRKIKSLKLNEALIDPEDPELIQDLVMLAVNEAIDKVNEAFDEMSAKFSGNGFPF